MIPAARRFTWMARAILVVVLLSAGVAAADEAQPKGVAVIPPGQEKLLADMLGLGATLPECAFAGAAAEHTFIRSRYTCPAGEVVFELRHPGNAPETARVTERFAIVLSSGEPPPSFAAALEARIRAREEAFEWTWTAGADREESPGVFKQIERAGGLTIFALTVVLVLGWTLLRVVKHRTTKWETVARSGGGALAVSSVAALVLSACVHGAFRVTGEAFSALIQKDADTAILTAAGMVLLLVAAATLAVAALARFATSLRLRLWVGVLVIAYLTVGCRLSLLPDDLHYFGTLSTFAPNITLDESVAGGAPVTYRINRHGLRKPDFEVRKRDGTIRVAMIGDSFMFGIGVDEEGTLPHHLAAELTRRWPTSRFEVLNLGIPGDNLSSHVEMFATATDRLDADVVLLGLTLPNDLSRWDEQAARRDARRMSTFSFVRFLVGDAAESLWALMFLERSTTPAGLEHLDRQMSRLERIRNRSVLSVLFGFSSWNADVVDRLQALPNAIVVPNRTTLPAEFIAGDGHPTSIGNQRSAAHIAGTLSDAPSWRRLLGEPPVAP